MMRGRVGPEWSGELGGLAGLSAFNFHSRFIKLAGGFLAVPLAG